MQENRSFDHYFGSLRGVRGFGDRGRGRATHQVDPLRSSNGWYDLSVAVNGDSSWSRRYTGHLEDGTDSVTG